MRNFFTACAGVCLILGFVAFGYIIYKFIGGWAYPLTAIFIFCSVVGLTLSIQETKKAAERDVHRLYEK